MTSSELSPRRLAIYEYLCSFTLAHGFPPSVREIGKAVGLASPSTVHTHLTFLEKKGFIKRDSRKPRAIEVVFEKNDTQDFQQLDTNFSPAEEELCSKLTLSDSAGATPRQGADQLHSQAACSCASRHEVVNIPSNLIELPLVGQVAAGVPILAEEHIEETFALPVDVVGDSSSFILRVKGNSMINAGIFDGDYISVREQADAPDGEIVVALIDDSATVKRLYHEKDGLRLQPENDSMLPIFSKEAQIIGKVTGLFRRIR